MLQNWLKPHSKSLADILRRSGDACFGNHVLLFQKDLPDLRQVRVALIGTDETSSTAVRKTLAQYAWQFPEGAVADLGNMRKSDTTQLVQVLYELITGNVLPILIGGNDEMARAQFLAYQEAKAMVNWASVDEVFRLPDAVVSPRHPLLFHFALLGAQAHTMTPEQQKLLDKNNFELLRLGRLRANFEEAEPVIRDADLMSFHIGALKSSEAPGTHLSATPSGFFLEEACQITRYAGLSDKLTSLGIYGFDAAKDPGGQTAASVAQLIWYFIDGFFNRKGDYPVSLKGLNEYVVDLPHYNYQLTFWKSTSTGRWWLQVPVDTKRKLQRHRLIPCSYQDYQAACRQELPDRLFNAFKRF